MLEHLKDYWIPYLMGFLILVFIGFIGWCIWVDSKAETFELRKAEWTCAVSENQMTTTNILVGKTIVPQVQIIEVCTEYKRIR